MPHRPSRLLLTLVLPAFCLAQASAPSAEVATVGKMLTDLGPMPMVHNDVDLKAYQDRLTQKYVGQTVTYDAGVIIQIITEGGGVKLVSFPPEETTDTAKIGRGLSYAALQESEEAAGKKLAPGDSVKITGTVASVSVKFDEATGDTPTAHVHVTVKDAKIAGTTVVPRGKKKATTVDQ